MDGPATIPGSMSTVGIDFTSWDETHALETDNGAIFFMDPDHGATTEPVVVAQLTVYECRSKRYSAAHNNRHRAFFIALSFAVEELRNDPELLAMCHE